jgi:hypothetical protein
MSSAAGREREARQAMIGGDLNAIDACAGAVVRHAAPEPLRSIRRRAHPRTDRLLGLTKLRIRRIGQGATT